MYNRPDDVSVPILVMWSGHVALCSGSSMAERKDEAIVLALAPRGESTMAAELITRSHGRCYVLIRRGRGYGMVVGSLAAVRWSGSPRTAVSLELISNFAASLLGDALRVDALASCCALLQEACPEGDPLPEVFERTLEFITILSGGDAWETAYIRWEMALVRELGFGIELKYRDHRKPVYLAKPSCQVVASGHRATTLPIPGFLALDHATELRPAGSTREIVAGLALTDYLLAKKVFAAIGRRLPPARTRLVSRYLRTLA